ncbi:MAG: glycoside hydrolase family 25 protein [Lachnospiraceae bacterium]|nr:glycoside hydrolase family 25 protein [Lachnospiraceae bacterium]
MKKKSITVVLFAVSWIFLIGCGNNTSHSDKDVHVPEGGEVSVVELTIPGSDITVSEDILSAGNGSADENGSGKEADTVEVLRFVDAFGEEYETEILEAIPKHEYHRDSFLKDGELLSYQDDKYTSRVGIDVSKYQSGIDWDQVKAQGIDFVFIRIGFRGYGEAGTINADPGFEEHIAGAQAAGLDVGVYFFSQAVNEEEAVEEAEFVIEQLKDHELQLPVVYDPETIIGKTARTDNVTGEQFTANTIAFCKKISECGYEPMVYCNMKWEAFELDLSRMTDIPIWYADYESYPQTPYHFEIWQYSEKGQIDGIKGEVDLNLQLCPR